MIIKYFELKKKISPKNNYYLLYGNNIGLIEETIKNDLKPILSSNIYHYDESDIIKNEERFIENNLNKSFFEDKKLLIINRVTDKILKIIEEIIKLKIEDISIILISGILEKKSKIRNFFEKNTNTICVPFYEDTNQSLIKAIGSAAAIGFIIALFGTIGFLFSGNYLNANLPLSVGFLNIPAFLIFFPITAFMARLGAKASHRINKKKMTKYFGLFLIVIGTKFLYEYFNL